MYDTPDGIQLGEAPTKSGEGDAPPPQGDADSVDRELLFSLPAILRKIPTLPPDTDMRLFALQCVGHPAIRDMYERALQKRKHIAQGGSTAAEPAQKRQR